MKSELKKGVCDFCRKPKEVKKIDIRGSIEHQRHGTTHVYLCKKCAKEIMDKAVEKTWRQ
jgi:hypothetical protein